MKCDHYLFVGFQFLRYGCSNGWIWIDGKQDVEQKKLLKLKGSVEIIINKVLNGNKECNYI